MKCISMHSVKHPVTGVLTTVPCGKCMPCRVNHAQDWRFRLEAELPKARSAVFLTLTINDENLVRNDQGFPVLVKKDLQKFWYRVRRDMNYRTQKYADSELPNKHTFLRFPPVKYYAVGEYGGESWRPHYHAIAFNISLETLKKIDKLWPLGFVKVGTVTPQSIGYVTKYITKIDSRDLDSRGLEDYPPFNCMSKGVGITYVDDATKEYHEKQSRMMHRVRKYRERLPQYYKDKIHDLSDPVTIGKLKKYRDKMRELALDADTEKYLSLHEKGVNIYEYEKREIEALINTLSKNNKRNKL